MAQDVPFSSVKRLLESHGWTLTRISGSHHIFTKPGGPLISIPVHGGKVKAVYAQKAQQICRREGQGQ